MKKTSLIPILVCIILASCNGQSNTPTALLPFTPEPGSTITASPPSTLTSTPTRIQPTKRPITPTFTPFPPYDNKGVIFDYYVVGNLADFMEFFDPPSGNIITRLVLYDDGQLLIAVAGGTYKQKVLSSDEFKSFLSELEILGFYSLESNQKHNPTDDLYNFEGKYEEVKVIGGLKYCILVDADRARNLCVHESYLQFLIPEIKNILQYLDEYKPAGMTPYYPDRIFLSIRAADPSSDTLPAAATPWNENFPSLEFSHPSKYVFDVFTTTMYIDGDMAKEIYIFFENPDGSRVFTQNGKEYIVNIRILLPHEKVINAYQ
ncbi:MAG: hypothetical protein CVU39_14020 [Chloroflexi bacterium HGW-Chloroflexi-10]|nr:MAG: hypothetical protein CVU39_14020 [Chloroflexi bacterium HGW-Chloroflexi-10]